MLDKIIACFPNPEAIAEAHPSYLTDWIHYGYADIAVPKRNPDQWHFLKTARLLKGAGFSYLGNGAFSMVYSQPDYPGVAFKFSLKSADAYGSYAMWVRDKQNFGNAPACFPTVHDIRQVGPLRFYALERYVLFDDAPHELQVAWRTLYAWFVDCDWCRSMEDIQEFSEFLPTGVPEELHQAVVDIATYFYGVADLDLHTGNVMYDPNRGQLVITDPVSVSS